LSPATGEDRPRTEPASHAELPVQREVAFELLVKAVEDYAIFLLSTDGQILTWNSGAERIKGYRADEIIGQHFSAFYTPADKVANRPMRLLGWAARDGRVEDEGWRVRKDGTQFWADVVLTALRDEEGTLFGFAKITRDLTERREAEEQQRQLLAEQRARAAAEEALVARDQFLSIASHELKTPVAGLRLGIEALQRARAMGRLDEARLDANLQRMLRSTERLTDLVNELLDIARLTSDQAMLNVESADLVALVQETVERFVDLEPTASFTVQADGPLMAEVDPARLDQAITNLLDNAVKYSDDPAEVTVRLTADGTQARIAVADRGGGLPPDPTAGLFDAFGRGSNVGEIPGLGLGLHIVGQVVERHGGRVTASPRSEGRGAVFTIELPLRQAG
jgi:PAS domain S-box-containing protein